MGMAKLKQSGCTVTEVDDGVGTPTVLLRATIARHVWHGALAWFWQKYLEGDMAGDV